MKYKVGDKVKVVKQQARLEDYEAPIGSVGKILEVDCGDEDGLTYFVESNSFKGGWGENKDAWWFKEDDLELLSNESQGVGVIKTLYNPLISQEGGGHYKSRGIQPIEYSEANKLGACQHSIVKYITRHEDKNGIEDLSKIIHFTLLEAYFKYGVEGSEELKQRVIKLLGIKEGQG